MRSRTSRLCAFHYRHKDSSIRSKSTEESVGGFATASLCNSACQSYRPTYGSSLNPAYPAY
nr:MAG TPA: hypothetical protein [Caudoviricetes sp.]